MTYSIAENFNDQPTGAFLLWDTTIDQEANKGFMTTNQHVDVRNFRVGGTTPVLQTKLEAETQSVMEASVQTTLEYLQGSSGENWILSGTGLNAITVGPVSSKNHWGALTTTTTGAAISATLTSSMPKPINISAMTHLSIIFPDYNSFDTGTSYVQLCSDAAGDFSTNNSAQVLFSANLASMPELRLNISAFAQSGFNASAVTGVRIVLTKASAPSSGLATSVMAIRALSSTWVYEQMDFDTRLGALVMPVTLTGTTPGGGTGPIPLIRGQGNKSDPIPEDLAMNLYFNAGGTGGFLATGSNYNTIQLYWRELNNGVAGTGSYIVTRLRWNASGTYFDAWRDDYASSTLTSTSVYTEALAALTPASNYMFRVEMLGTNIIGYLYQVDGNGEVLATIWKSVGTTNTNYIYRNGRVGFGFNFQYDRDAFLTQLQSGVKNYAEFETVFYNQLSVVDGVQLAATFAADMNLWQSFSAPDIFVDQTKTVSGNGSYRTSVGLISNLFIVEDWNNTYLSFALWVPIGITPLVQIVSTFGQTNNLLLPNLQGNQWNYIDLELTVLNNLITGTGYTWQVISTPGQIGPFWVDSPTIGRRRVSWAVRAQANAPYRYFRELVNSNTGAVHFIVAERGTQLELRADALTSDAWASEFDLIPRHAQLGNPIYDVAYKTV